MTSHKLNHLFWFFCRKVTINVKKTNLIFKTNKSAVQGCSAAKFCNITSESLLKLPLNYCREKLFGCTVGPREQEEKNL